MSFGVETHRGFVNTWECDENEHLNVQFYWKRFGDAERIFNHLSGRTQKPWIDRHVRYHRELMVSTNTIVRSACCDVTHAHVHLLYNGTDNQISATALDQFESSSSHTLNASKIPPEESLPRSLPAQHLVPVETQAILQSKTGLITHRSVVLPAECDAESYLLDQYYIARFSDAAPHLWQHIGIDRRMMHKQNLGSVAVEMKVTRHAQVKASMMVEVVSWIGEIQEKTFSFRHQVQDIASGNVLYSGAVTALMIDMESRRAATLPDPIKKLML